MMKITYICASYLILFYMSRARTYGSQFASYKNIKLMGGFLNSHKIYVPKINVFYVDLGENMQLCFLYSMMPKLKISSIIPMYIHIFSPQTVNQSC